MRPLKCIFGFHEWFTPEEDQKWHDEYKDLEGYHWGLPETCKNCGWEKQSYYGFTSIVKPWEMSVKKMVWDKENLKYVERSK